MGLEQIYKINTIAGEDLSGDRLRLICALVPGNFWISELMFLLFIFPENVLIIIIILVLHNYSVIISECQKVTFLGGQGKNFFVKM